MKPAEPVIRRVFVFCDMYFILGRVSPLWGIPLKQLVIGSLSPA